MVDDLNARLRLLLSEQDMPRPSGHVNTSSSLPVREKQSVSATERSSTQPMNSLQTGPSKSKGRQSRQSEQYNQNWDANKYTPQAKVGTVLPKGCAVCPLDLISKFPRRFMSEDRSEEVAADFFDGRNFWNHQWEVYYLWPPQSVNPRPTFWLLKRDVDAFFATINRKTRKQLSLDSYQAELVIDGFPDHPKLRPRLLCKCSSIYQFRHHAEHVPPASFRPPVEKAANAESEPTMEQQMAYTDTMDRHNKSNRPQEVKASNVKHKSKVAKRREWRAGLKHAERLFGLRGPDVVISDQAPATSWKDVQAAENARKAARQIDPIDPSLAVPYAFEDQVVFICVDVECYERDKNKITEIGVTTLDTLDLIKQPPGENGKFWATQLRARHFRIREYLHLKNHEFVNGAPENFEFGKSEIVSLRDAPAAIASCFQPPFSAPASWKSPGRDNAAPKRNLVLVGHDVGNDIRYLRQIGYDLRNLSNLSSSSVDTSFLFRALMREIQARSLGGLLSEFDITAWHLHNAGNDAFYTMRVLLCIVLRNSIEYRGEETRKRRAELQKAKEESAIAQAVARVREEAEGWSSNEDADW